MDATKFKVKDVGLDNTPRWQQYAALTLGKTDGLSLLKYELIVLFCSGLPGALGLYLRSKLYPSLLGAVGSNVVFGRGVTLRHPHKIRIGSNVIIDDHCVLDAKGGEQSGITLGDGVFIGRNSIIYCKDGAIEIQDQANISANCQLYSGQKLVVGKGTLIAAFSYLMSGGSYDYHSQVPLAEQNGYAKGPTLIGSNCWLGAKSVVLDGIAIGDNTVIGAGAVVTKNIAADAIALGTPAKVIGSKQSEQLP